MTDAEREVIESAFIWWKDHRPSAWTIRDHCERPDVNTTSSHEASLAEAVARIVHAGTSFGQSGDRSES